MQLVVRKDWLSVDIMPKRCNVSVSSMPSSRLLRADWFISSSSGLSAFNAFLAASYVGLEYAASSSVYRNQKYLIY